MKKLGITAAVLVLAASVSFGAGNQADSGTTVPSGGADLYNPAGTMPIVKERIALNILAPGQDNNLPWEDNLQTKELEALTGIDLNWQISPGNAIREKINLVFASGDLPDLIFAGVGTRLNKTTEALYGTQGLIIPLNKYYDTVSMGYKTAFAEMPGMREFITAPDGNIYSLPNVDGSFHVQYNCKLWLNTVWLKNLGLSMPTTTEEFYQVLKAFKERDANGNGNPNDEIPLSTVKSGSGTQIDGFLMNPFQLTPELNKLYLDNGKVNFSPVTDNYREGLRYLRRLFAEGLINPESWAWELRNQVNANENGPVPVIGAFLAQRPGYANDLSTLPNSKKWEQYQPLAPLKGPSGKAVAAWNPYIQYQLGMVFITHTSKYPEAAFRLIDYVATREGTMRSSFGIKGTHWVDAAPGELGLDGTQAEVKLTGAPTDNVSWTQLAGLVRSRRITDFVVTNPDPYAPTVKPLDGRQIVMYRGSLDHEKVRQPLESVLPELYQQANEVEEIAMLRMNVMDYHNEAIVRFITGALSIDRDWDTYKQQLNNVGLDRYIALLQSAYDKSSFAKK